jgi:hypothetical protein
LPCGVDHINWVPCNDAIPVRKFHAPIRHSSEKKKYKFSQVIKNKNFWRFSCHLHQEQCVHNDSRYQSLKLTCLTGRTEKAIGGVPTAKCRTCIYSAKTKVRCRKSKSCRWEIVAAAFHASVETHMLSCTSVLMIKAFMINWQ